MFSPTLRKMRVNDARRQIEMFERSVARASQLASLEVVTKFAASNVAISYDLDWDLEEGALEDTWEGYESSLTDSDTEMKSSDGQGSADRPPRVDRLPDENDPADRRSDINSLLWLLTASNIEPDHVYRNTSRTEASDSDVSMADSEDIEQRTIDMAEVQREPDTQSGRLESAQTPEMSTSVNPPEPGVNIATIGAPLATDNELSAKRFPPGIHIEHVENVERIEGTEYGEDVGSLDMAQLEGSSQSAMPRPKDVEQQVLSPSTEKKPARITLEFLESIWDHCNILKDFCEWVDAHECNRTNLRKMLREPLNRSRSRHRKRTSLPYPPYGRSRSPLGVTMTTEWDEQDPKPAYSAERVKW
ncbi:hypothetical protein CORC01_00749 [Colletotrichum orchidophilum]|uniref:Uncharacterized protein n=1 Tax=Colletotrichum orchidophilum TaxID=1209926 RepID=A0A1G4BRJ2_9PEZI|nr:uncharacterized protein CORC01_00749 [Colletotrichum orchidophilum]OHF03887.1 hypothetical protein CORC01_00749 [Colletotrichum orchidophilum]